MASIFLPSQRSRQLRGPNFGNLNSPDSGAPGTPAAAAGGGGGGFGTPTSLFNMGAGAEGAGGSPESGNNNSYGQTETWGGFLGGLASPALAGLAMVNNPNALSVGASLYGGKPTSLASKISDAFDTDVVNPNVAAPGKAAGPADLGKADKGTGDLGKADFDGVGQPGGASTAGNVENAPSGDPADAANNSPEGGKSETPADGGAKARTGAFLAPPPGGSMEPQPVDVTAHTGEFILRPEISMAIGPELLTAVNSGIIPPEIVAEALMALLEQYDPGYNDQQMPVAGPNGTMMPGNMGGPMGMGGGQPPSVIPMGGGGDMGMGDGEGDVAGAIQTDGFHPGAPAIGGPPSNLPPTADPRQSMQPPPGIPPEEDAPVSPAYRSGGMVGHAGQRNWRDRGRMDGAAPSPVVRGGLGYGEEVSPRGQRYGDVTREQWHDTPHGNGASPTTIDTIDQNGNRVLLDPSGERVYRSGGQVVPRNELDVPEERGNSQRWRENEWHQDALRRHMEGSIPRGQYGREVSRHIPNNGPRSGLDVEEYRNQGMDRLYGIARPHPGQRGYGREIPITHAPRPQPQVRGMDQGESGEGVPYRPSMQPRSAFRDGGQVQGPRKSLLGDQERQRWRERGEMAPPGPDAAGGGDDMEDRINAPKSQWPYATGRRSALRGG